MKKLGNIGLSIAIGTLGLSTFGAGSAAAAIVGSNDGGNCYPFSCGPSDNVSTYQQIYSSTEFSDSINIDSINFFKHSGSGDMDSGVWKLSFSTTSRAVGALSTNWVSNIGSDNAVFGTFSIGGAMPDILNLDGNNFTYDPTKGNLLMTVELLSSSLRNGYGSFFQADRTGTTTRRLFAYNSSSVGRTRTNALVTEFQAAEAIPTPALLPGLIGMGVATFSKKRKAAAVSEEA